MSELLQNVEGPSLVASGTAMPTMMVVVVVVAKEGGSNRDLIGECREGQNCRPAHRK